MRHATVGVIGHVNHGKTSLVKSLTGTDTDRLEEERRRGMSIVLGFAWLRTPEGDVDLIDVPGHEQFVRTMVAGATGIDASLLVVHAREGVMPQTAEHVAIADLVGVRRGIVAITKADLVGPQERAQVQRQVRAFLRGTHLEFAPVVFTSTVDEEGIVELRTRLAALAASTPAGALAGPHFWLPVDRVFSLPGHGTIATGTLRGAPLRVGDVVVAFPHDARGAVRQLQVHHADVKEALPGQRVGVNLRHLAPDQVRRGDVLAPVGTLRPATLLDVALVPAPGTLLGDLDARTVRILFGTTEASARVRVLSREEGPRGRLLAQLRTDRPVVAVAGEPCILRRESPPSTLAGGRVLDPAPGRHARSDAGALRRLRVLAGGSGRQRLAERLRAAGAAGLPLATLAAEAGLDPSQFALVPNAIAVVDGQHAWHVPLARALEQRMVDALRAHHEAHPLLPAAPVAICRAALPRDVPDTLCRKLLDDLRARGEIVRRDGQVALRQHDPLETLDAAGRERLATIEAAFRAGGMSPPDVPDDARGLLQLLVARGDILLLPGQPPLQRIAFHRSALAEASERLRAAFPPPGGFTVSQAREMLASTRKFTVPLLEYLHASGQTRRRGDLHAFVRETVAGGV